MSISEHLHKNHPRSWSLRDISFWFIVGALVSISLLHYVTDVYLIPYYSIHRSLYYVPIVIGDLRYGRRGSIADAPTQQVELRSKAEPIP